MRRRKFSRKDLASLEIGIPMLVGNIRAFKIKAKDIRNLSDEHIRITVCCIGKPIGGLELVGIGGSIRSIELAPDEHIQKEEFTLKLVPGRYYLTFEIPTISGSSPLLDQHGDAQLEFRVRDTKALCISIFFLALGVLLGKLLF